MVKPGASATQANGKCVPPSDRYFPARANDQIAATSPSGTSSGTGSAAPEQAERLTSIASRAFSTLS